MTQPLFKCLDSQGTNKITHLTMTLVCSSRLLSVLLALGWVALLCELLGSLRIPFMTL